MTDQTEGTVPKIRFKGYDAPWVPKKLGQIYAERNERGNDSLPILSVSIHSGISTGELSNEALGKKVRRSKDKSLYKHVRSGDLVLNMMRAWQGALGVAKTEGMVSPAYLTATPDDTVYPLFMDCGLRRPQVVAQMNKLSYGVTDFRKRLYWDSFVRVQFAAPSVPEQQKIASYFSDLDSMIALHQRKHEKLLVLRSVMLQKMFPQPGSAVPEVRFANFTSPWDSVPLGKLGQPYAGLFGKTKEDFGCGDARFVTYMGVFSNAISGPADTEAIGVDRSQNEVKTGDVMFTISSETPEEVGMSSVWSGGEANVYLNSFCFGFRPLASLRSEFMAYVLRASAFRSRVRVLAQGISRYNISKAKVMNIPIGVPTEEEQERIGMYFCALDGLIAKHATQVQKLRQIKSACLEAMFV
ncbi:restriction endonuclease subunit S domain-containing protein [Crenobacter intestini]|uniref:Restriction endonuclease subunit S n=1 Tax=Crenobacter intestini TaxID=2563443 RepID=A0A4T0UJE4_9NEIS|nr:restriction endonuclease subunit S [Crenobacter intestini]TIC78476.1 restriction endonuclease subunit S [Crenobacter intestini]